MEVFKRIGRPRTKGTDKERTLVRLYLNKEERELLRRIGVFTFENPNANIRRALRLYYKNLVRWEEERRKKFDEEQAKKKQELDAKIEQQLKEEEESWGKHDKRTLIHKF